MIPERASIHDGAARSLIEVLGPDWVAYRNPPTNHCTHPGIQRPGPAPQVAINGAAGAFAGRDHPRITQTGAGAVTF